MRDEALAAASFVHAARIRHSCGCRVRRVLLLMFVRVSLGYHYHCSVPARHEQGGSV